MSFFFLFITKSNFSATTNKYLPVLSPFLSLFSLRATKQYQSQYRSYACNQFITGSGEKRRAPTVFFCYYRQLIYEGMNERQSIRRFYERRSWLQCCHSMVRCPVYKRPTPPFLLIERRVPYADVLLSIDAAAAAIV